MGREMTGRYGVHSMGSFCIGGLCCKGLGTSWGCLLQSSSGAWKDVSQEC